MKKLAYIIIFSLIMCAFAGCGPAESEPTQQSTQAPTTAASTTEAPTTGAATTISGSGTEEDPWLIGAGDPESVRAFAMDIFLNIDGEGAMIDFASAEDAPWHDIAAYVEMASVFDGVTNVGAHAFDSIGKNVDMPSIYLGATITEIGEGAFEGANFGDFSTITLSEEITKIGSRAFADATLSQVQIFACPEIAEDAFAGVTAEMFYLPDQWDEAKLADYGGTLTWKKLVALSYEEVYEGDDASGEGTYFFAEGETFSYNAADYCMSDEYRFDHYEVLGGNIVIENPEDPELNITVNEDCSLRIVYVKN